MKIVIIILVTLFVLIALMYLIGYFMQVKHIASAEKTFSGVTPAQVWKYIATPAEFPSWRSGLKDVQILDNRNWKETSSDGVLHFYAEVAEPEKHLVCRIMNKDLPFGGYWAYEIKPAQTGTTLVITEHGEVYNPLFRFMSKYFFGHDATLKKYLSDLQQQLDKK